jgi:transposase
LRRETGDIKVRPHSGGRRPAISEKQLERIKKRLAEKPDATLDELRRYCRTSGSIMAVQRCLIREGITLKKRH